MWLFPARLRRFQTISAPYQASFSFTILHTFWTFSNGVSVWFIFAIELQAQERAFCLSISLWLNRPLVISDPKKTSTSITPTDCLLPLVCYRSICSYFTPDHIMISAIWWRFCPTNNILQPKIHLRLSMQKPKLIWSELESECRRESYVCLCVCVCVWMAISHLYTLHIGCEIESGYLRPNWNPL